MKHFITAVLLLLILGPSAFSQKVGKLENGNPVLTANREVMMQNLEITLKKHAKIAVKFESAEIVTDKGNYYLVFRSSRYTTKFQLLVKNGALVAAAISCTTTSCASTSGCTPDWMGRSCSQCSGDCTKVTSSFQLGTPEVLGDQ